MKVKMEEIHSRPAADQIAAVRLDRLYEIPSSLILQPGPAALTEGIGPVACTACRRSCKQATGGKKKT